MIPAKPTRLSEARARIRDLPREQLEWFLSHVWQNFFCDEHDGSDDPRGDPDAEVCGGDLVEVVGYAFERLNLTLPENPGVDT